MNTFLQQSIYSLLHLCKAMASKDYQWYTQADLQQYRGEWVAIASQHVVAHGLNARRVLEEARKKCPKETPALAKVPKEDILVL